MQNAPLFVLSGPSGAGKSTVVEALLAQCRYPLRRAITATTRQPRPGEVPEVDYHFWTREQFEEAIAQNAMVEHAIVFGKDYYGTPRFEVEPHRAAGTGALLVIDVQGAAQVRAQYPADHCSIFLAVPSFQELEQRLRSRGTETEDKIARRLAAAETETARANEFDRTIVNDTVPNAVAQLLNIIEHEFTRRGIPCSTN